MKSVGAVTTHPDKRSISVIRIIAINPALVVSSTNIVSVCDGGLFVDMNPVGERFPEQVLATAVPHIEPGKQAGLDGVHPLRVQFILSKALGNLAVKGDPFVWVKVVSVRVSHYGIAVRTFITELIPHLLLLWPLQRQILAGNVVDQHSCFELGGKRDVIVEVGEGETLVVDMMLEVSALTFNGK